MNGTRTRRQRTRGFTMVELMASMAVSAVVLLAAMSLMNIMTSQWTKGKDRKELSREATLAVDRIVREVHSAKIDSISISAGGDTLKIGDGKRFFKNAAGDLEFVDPAAPMNYLEGMTTSFIAIMPLVKANGDTLANTILVEMTYQHHDARDSSSVIVVPRTL